MRHGIDDDFVVAVEVVFVFFCPNIGETWDGCRCVCCGCGVIQSFVNIISQLFREVAMQCSRADCLSMILVRRAGRLLHSAFICCNY